ncbi:hypothetical protein [Salinarimonas rosea]|uniref:hypothetical protein n=1 Tax=Salinarimonas rosea TaxID=552063 RepID=UPI000425131A|nr:hypothetical protein [Salinarimonas rosea]
MSTAYYAVFHCLCRSAADLLVGETTTGRSEPAWQHVYRSLNHGSLKRACRSLEILALPSSDLAEFANLVVRLQTKRHAADYDPCCSFRSSEVLADVASAEIAIVRFQRVGERDKRAFLAFVMLDRRS